MSGCANAAGIYDGRLGSYMFEYGQHALVSLTHTHIKPLNNTQLNAVCGVPYRFESVFSKGVPGDTLNFRVYDLNVSCMYSNSNIRGLKVSTIRRE